MPNTTYLYSIVRTGTQDTIAIQPLIRRSIMVSRVLLGFFFASCITFSLSLPLSPLISVIDGLRRSVFFFLPFFPFLKISKIKFSQDTMPKRIKTKQKYQETNVSLRESTARRLSPPLDLMSSFFSPPISLLLWRVRGRLLTKERGSLLLAARE